MDADYEGFSIREYTRNIRSVELRKCWPFPGEATGDLIQSLLPPLTVAKFRWWSHELASLLTKSPVTPDDSESAFRRKAKAKSSPCKKRSIVEIFAEAPQIQVALREDERDDSDGSKRKRKRMNDVVLQKKIKGKKPKDSTGEEIFQISPKSVTQDWDSEFQIPGILKAKRKVCSLRSPDKSSIDDSRHVGFSDPSEIFSHFFSVELCCSQMNRLSLFSAEDQSSSGNDKKRKVISNDQTSDNMQLESRQFHPVVSERRLSHARAKSGLSCFPKPHLSLERIKDALDLERQGHVVAQPISTSSESPYGSCSSSSQLESADMQCGTLLNESPFDPLLVEWMQQQSVFNTRQRHVEVEEAVSGFPLNLQGELVETDGDGRTRFDRSRLGNGSSRSASAENDAILRNLVDFSSVKKHSTETEIAKDVGRSSVHHQKRHNYYPARLGIDETFTEKAFFISDTNDGECHQTVLSPVSQVNPRSHTMNLNQSFSSRNMVANRDGLCLHNSQATMRLMGNDVSVGTSYSDMVRTGERIIAPDASMGRYTQQSWLWRTTALGILENHSTTTLDKNWNINMLCDTSKDPYPWLCEPHVGLARQVRTAVVPDSGYPPTILHPCVSLASFPLADKDLFSFHESGLEQQLNSVTFSQQQLLPFLSNPEINGLPSDYSNVGIGLLPDARNPSLGLPFSCTDSTRQAKPHWPPSSYESSRSTEQLVSLYGSRSSSRINVGKANKHL
ncbi:unnamed protein product [Thlaspi arvense]|uniref:Uncharacterized protein n=1 Tax=Thlaspi arvense TaxID=13288 RepID=A0AAU9SEG5_THLAR|nr:unnamed protein product [Thlaspi arvense]